MEPISRLSSVLESSRSLTLDAASVLRSRNPKPPNTAQLQRLLDSKHEREVLDGLRSVIALSRQSNAGPPLLFSAVLKNIASPSLAVKKLVYLYLLQHAESEPDTALLAINTIQKTLSASDPHVRALALRTMSGIRVPVISQIVSLAIKKGCGDMSALVRKAAALAIPKCWRLDPGSAPQLIEYLGQLLGDRQYFVVGAAVAAFLEICPDRLDLIHRHYRSLVKKLVDMDEWGQIATLRLMCIYARRCFPLRTRFVKRSALDTNPSGTEFYDDDEDGDAAAVSSSDKVEIPVIDPDLTLLLTSARPLLHSRTSAVILAVTRLYASCVPSTAHAPNTYLPSTAGPLVALLRSPPAIAQIALRNILSVATTHPSYFLPYLTHFLPSASSSTPLNKTKLAILTAIFPVAPATAQSLILTDLAHFASSPSSPLVGPAVAAIGRCAASSSPGSQSSRRCLKLLLAQLRAAGAATHPELVAHALTVVRHLIQADPAAHAETVTRLAKDLDAVASGPARASVVWLVAEFGDQIAPDVLRILLKGFADESDEAKASILLLGAKVYLRYLNGVLQQIDAGEDGQDGNTGAEEEDAAAHPIAKLWTHLLHLVRYDVSYSLRDAARVYRALLPPAGVSPWKPDRATTQLASLLLLAPKPVPVLISEGVDDGRYMLGSASLALGEDVGGDELPAWVSEGNEPAPEVRADGEYVERKLEREVRSVIAPAVGIAAGISAAGVGGKSLDAWLDEEDDDDDDEEEESEDETDEDDEEEEESSEEDEEETDEESEDEGQALMKS